VTTFAIELSAEDASERIDNVVSFVGADASGSFGILPRRAPLATTLAWGLCAFRTADDERHYLAVPGGVLLFTNGVLHLATRRYVREDDPQRIVERLTQEMQREQESTRAVHELLRNLDRELLRHLLRT
jgi:F-type H+-transporting ATPase subunit epsilon